MERWAELCWGTGPSTERKERREREEEERSLFMFHLELPSTDDPWTTPPGSCVACQSTHTHTHTPAQYTKLILDLILALSFVFTRRGLCRFCHHLLFVYTSTPAVFMYNIYVSRFDDKLNRAAELNRAPVKEKVNGC